MATQHGRRLRRARANFKINLEGAEVGEGKKEEEEYMKQRVLRQLGCDAVCAKCFPIITGNFKRFAGDRANAPTIAIPSSTSPLSPLCTLT